MYWNLLFMDYQLLVWIILGTLLVISIISVLINHNKKTKSNQEVCTSCRGMGFIMTYTSRPIPPCTKCNGTGYLTKK